MTLNQNSLPLIDQEDYYLLQQLREQEPAQNPPVARASLGQRFADLVAAVVGSWRFIIIQSTILAAWLVLNVTTFIRHWDPYPFILLNLVLSFQAAYTAPIIMMSQNRQADIDRQDAKHDYEVNMKAELEIELLHDRLARLHGIRERELADIITRLQMHKEQIERIEALLIDRSIPLGNRNSPNSSSSSD